MILEVERTSFCPSAICNLEHGFTLNVSTFGDAASIVIHADEKSGFVYY